MRQLRAQEVMAEPGSRGDDLLDYEFGNRDDYPAEPEPLCSCGRATCGEGCQQCGLPLCPMCFEAGAGFCGKHPDDSYRPDPHEEPEAMLEAVAEDLRRLDFVQWDRYAEADGELAIYGWIPRSDGRSDFVVLLAEPGGVGYVTSSAKHSVAIGNILAGEPAGSESSTHGPCRRIEVALPDLANVARARRGASGEK